MKLIKKVFHRKDDEKPGQAEAVMPHKASMHVKVIRASGEIEDLGEHSAEVERSK